MKEHRAQFRGKVSPVQFYWGSFDLSTRASRASGRAASDADDSLASAAMRSSPAAASAGDAD
jgi:hypothetical protein